MNIQVICRGHQFYREIELILQLFFEQMHITFLDGNGQVMEQKVRESADPHGKENAESYHITLVIEGSHQIIAHAELMRDGRNEPLAATHHRQVFTEEHNNSDEIDPMVWRKRAKQAMSHVLIQVLEEETGMEQPWGILTGIRPTKLMHQLLTDGASQKKVHRQLQEDYLVKQQKVSLLQQIVDRQLTVLPDLYDLHKEVSIYIGIPFCPTKCAYCTFPAYAINGRNGSVEAFLAGLHHEMEQIGHWLKENGIGVTTIYFGGGTPTSIEAEQMDQLFHTMSRFLQLDAVRELTVEAGRPDTITPEKIEVMKKWKVDRISINPQSFTDETLHAIGRHHSVEETVEKYRLSREMGMNNINMDLIIGLPGEDRRQLAHSLEQVEKLMPESLTVHTLSFKRASAMTKNKEKYKVADRSEIEQMMKIASEWTGTHGYVPYYLYRQKNILGNLENVGYALPGKESLYNIIIMEEKQTILGLGCGAVGKHIHPGTGKIERWPNPKDPKTYIDTYQELTEKKIQDLSEMYGIVMQ